MSGTVVLTQTQRDSNQTTNGYSTSEDRTADSHTERHTDGDGVEEREAELVVFDNCSKGLGIKICGGCSRDGKEENGIFIKRILPGGLADIDGNLQQGDQILEVNGDSFEGVTNERAVSVLRQASATNQVEMVITRDQQAKSEFMDILEKQNGMSFPCTPVPPEFQLSRSNTPALKGVEGSKSPFTVNTAESGKSPRASPRPNQLNLQKTSHVPDEHVVPNGHLPEEMLNGQSLYDERFSPPGTDRGVAPSYPQGQPRRNILPSMSSTPQVKGQDRSHRSYSLSPMTTLSPVQGSMFLSPQTSYSTQSLPRPNRPHTASRSRKLSLDPTVRLRIEKLEVALRYLGLNPTPEQESALRQRLRVSRDGTVNYGDFVAHARDIFKQELLERNIDPRAMLFAASDIHDMLEPPSFRPNMTNFDRQMETVDSLRLERDELLMEIQRLKLKVHESDAARLRMEEEMFDIKQKALAAIDESHSLRKKVHIAERAQKAARNMEHDYEEVVHLLEGEIAKLKTQSSTPIDNATSQQKIALLSCQLKKSEAEKRTYEVATEKLLKFAEGVHEAFRGQSSRQPLNANPGSSSRGVQLSGFLGNHKPVNPKNVSSEAKEIIQAVITLIETEPLPYGWEEAYTEDGLKYYINHIQQITTWSHPRSGVQQISDKPSAKPSQQPENKSSQLDSKTLTKQPDGKMLTKQPESIVLTNPDNKVVSKPPVSQMTVQQTNLKQRIQPGDKQPQAKGGKQA